MKINRLCKNCNKEFEMLESALKYGRGKFCSKNCQYKGMWEHIKIYRVCFCGTKFSTNPYRIKVGRGKFCSKQCASKGRENPSWKGGKRTNGGYVLIWKPDHPNANSSGYVMEHRLVMEMDLGRYLEKEEIVHHKNHVRDDNRIVNLMLLNSKNDHSSIHMKAKWKEWKKVLLFHPKTGAE